LRESGEASLPHGIVFVARHEHADAPHAVALLRRLSHVCKRTAMEKADDRCRSLLGVRHHRPRRRAPEPCDEFPPPHPRSPALTGGPYPGPRGVETAPLPSRFRSSSGRRATLMVLVVAFGMEIGWLMADP
jgi:hypothetical protein